MDAKGDAGSVQVAPIDDSPPGTVRQPRESSALRLGPLLGLLAGVALIWATPWAGDSTAHRVDADIQSLAALAPFESPAVYPRTTGLKPAATVEAFVTAINLGNPDAAMELMSPELLEVPGLGTTHYPRLAGDPGLWVDGRLDGTTVARFAHRASNQIGALYVSNCESFADGPTVIIAACAYTATGPSQLGEESQTGRLFGFVVDGKIAGLVHRTD